MSEAPIEIVASVDWETIKAMRLKMSCVTAGSDGIPAPFEPCHYVRRDISRNLLEALEELLNSMSADAGEIDRTLAMKDARAAIARAKGGGL